jgi:hypothetical protein
MELEFVPLLQLQRDLYSMPRDMERFRAYIRTMVDPDTEDLKLPPLGAINPMAREHVPALLDQYLEFDAEGIADAAVASVRGELRDEPGQFKVGLAIADDLRGGWTNRYTTEFTHRFEQKAVHDRGWIVGLLWSSEPASQKTVREEILCSIHRTSYVQRHGRATSLRSMLAQEGAVMTKAGCTEPELDADDLAYTREIIEPLLDATDRATIMACLFGDEVANMLGYRPQGLSRRAGFALALHEARSCSVRL